MTEVGARSKMSDEKKTAEEENDVDDSSVKRANRGSSRSGCPCRVQKILVFIGAFYQDCLFGATLAWSSMFYVEWMDYFGTDKGPTAWVSSINIASIFIFGVVYSCLIDRFSCRFVGMAGGLLACLAALATSFANGVPALCVTYGFLNGFGVGMMFLSSIVIIQQHFHKHRALAGAFAMGGASIGALLAGSGIPYLTGIYGWRGAFFIVAGFLLNGVAAGALYFPVTEKNTKGGKISDADTGTKDNSPIYKYNKKASSNEDPTKEECLLQESTVDSQPEDPAKENTSSTSKCGQLSEVFDISLLKNVCFLLYLSGTFTFNVCMNLVMQHLPSAAIFKGVDKERAGMLISVVGLSTIPSYLATGLIGTIKGVNRVLFYGVTIVITGTVGSLMFLTSDFPSFCAFAVAFGASYSSSIAIQPSAMVDLVGLDSIVKAAGFNCLAMGVGCLISVPFAGFLVDEIANYNVPYAIGGTIGIIGGILTSLVMPIQKRQQGGTSAMVTDGDNGDATAA